MEARVLLILTVKVEKFVWEALVEQTVGAAAMAAAHLAAHQHLNA